MNRREKALTTARRGTIVTGLALIGLAGVYVRALMFTPIERFQGPAQKILYVHAPVAWAALMAFAVTGILSLLYLIMRDRKLDTIAHAELLKNSRQVRFHCPLSDAQGLRYFTVARAASACSNPPGFWRLRAWLAER